MTDNKIRILMVLGNTGRGGSQAYVMNILRNIDWNRFQVDIATCWNEEGGFHEEMMNLGCKIHILPYFKVYNYAKFVSIWDKFLSEHHYDIVHGHSTNSASVYLKVAKKHGCATIAHSHSAGYRGNKAVQLVKKFFAGNAGKYADYWFACSEKAAIRLFGDNYKEYPRYYDIPNAINVENYLFDEDKRMQIRRQLGVNDACFLCGHVGTFSQPKNHTFLLDIFTEILKLKPGSKLLMCGEGALMPVIKEKANALGIYDKLIFTGNVTNVNEYLMAMDVMIFPSLFEGFPVSVIEAQSTGLTVVMSDVITTEVDLTDCVHRMSLNDSPREWAQCAIRVKAVDRKSYNRIISDSHYNVSTSIKQLESLYNEMVQ